MRAAPLALLVAVAALAGCAEDPFVFREINSTVDKPVNTVTRDGLVSVCHGDTAQWATVEEQAAEACGEFGYFAKYSYSLRYQCRVSAPHKATFACYHPDMTSAQGTFINPSNHAAIAEWQKRTGKMAPKRRIALPGNDPVIPTTLPLAPQMPGTAKASENAEKTQATAPAATRTAPPPLTPADIAGKPAFDPSPVQVEKPPLPMPSAPPSAGYALPMDSWGKHFEE